MDISYKPLWRQLLEKDMKKSDLTRLGGLSANLIAKMSKNEYISMKNLLRICEILECDISDVVEIKR